jgi:electron transport complex protein RnfC
MQTFRIGGIHPPSNKLSAGNPIETLAPPSKVVIPLGQHIGAPATAVVAKGDKVKVGTLIGKATGFVSANVHSSVSGTVSKVDTFIDGAGLPRPAVFIDTESDEWEESIDRSYMIISECDLTPKEIVSRIEAAGIVGMGGATFPTHVKLSPPPGSKAEILIINAVECEPYLTADHSLMLAHAEEIIIGTQLLMKAVNVRRAVIGIEANKPDAIKMFNKVLYENHNKAQNLIKVEQSSNPSSTSRHCEQSEAISPQIEILPLKIRYPQGGEKQLIDAVIRRQVASGALPVSVGAVVQNVGTVFAVYEAVLKNKPLIERVITVTGKSLAKPSNFLARIGTPVSTLIEAAGGLPEDTGKIIGGGPMMGKAYINADAPVTKGSSGILLLSEKDAKRTASRDCIRCAKCVGACPMGLEPSLLMNLAELKIWDLAEKNYVVDCIECGSCSYTCPANRPLLDYIRLGKTTVMGIIRARKS